MSQLKATCRWMIVTSLWAIFLKSSGVSSHCDSAADGDQTADELSFSASNPPAFVRSTVIDAHVKLSCCVHNYASLEWLRYDNATKYWRQAALSRAVYFQDTSNQTLVIKRTSQEDVGLYRCHARDRHGNEIHHDIVLEIVGSADLDHPPQILQPTEGVRSEERGTTFILTCEAIFGTGYEHSIIADLLWERVTVNRNGTPTVTEWHPEHSTVLEKRINISISLLADRQVSVLEVRNLTNEDYGNYTCHAMNLLGTTSSTVALRMAEPVVERPDQLHPVLAGVLGGSTLVIFGVCLLVWLKWRDIRLLLKDRFATPMYPGALFDALLIYNEHSAEDSIFVAETLAPKLENELNYRLCIPEREPLCTQYLADSTVDHIEQSQSVMFLLTEATLQTEWLDFVFQYVVAKHYSNLVFIFRSPIQEDAWHEHHGPLRNVINTSKHVLYWPETAEVAVTFWKRLRLALPPRLTSAPGTIGMRNKVAYFAVNMKPKPAQ